MKMDLELLNYEGASEFTLKCCRFFKVTFTFEFEEFERHSSKNKLEKFFRSVLSSRDYSTWRYDLEDIEYQKLELDNGGYIELDTDGTIYISAGIEHVTFDATPTVKRIFEEIMHNYFKFAFIDCPEPVEKLFLTEINI